MEQSIEYGIDLLWLMLTIILCGVFLVWGYRLGYRQRKEEEREAIERSLESRKGFSGEKPVDCRQIEFETPALQRRERQEMNRQRWDREERKMRALVGRGQAPTNTDAHRPTLTGIDLPPI